MTPNTIERRTHSVLRQTGVSGPPYDVEEVARLYGLVVEPFDLGDDISGVLVIKQGKGFIGYNSKDAPVRQRFTIAHEFGHFVLHRDDEELFVDKSFAVVFRDSRSSKGEIRKEIEANAFAAALLMPAASLKQEIRKNYFDLADEDSLRTLANLFEVSISAMTYRIDNLDLLRSPF